MIPAFPIWSRRIRKEKVKVSFFFLSGFWPLLVITHIRPHKPSTGLLGRCPVGTGGLVFFWGKTIGILSSFFFSCRKSVVLLLHHPF